VRKGDPLKSASITNRILRLENLFYVVAFMTTFGFGIQLVPLPLVTVGRGGTVLTLGLLGSVTAFVYTCGCLAMGAVVGRLPAKGLAIAGTAVAGTGLVMLGRALTLPDIFEATMLSAAGLSVFWVSMQNWLGERSDASNLQRRTAAFNVSWCSGIVVGPWLGGVLFDRSESLPFYCGAAAVFSSMALVIATLRADGGTWSRRRYAAAAWSGSDPARNERVLDVVWTAQLTLWFAMAMILSIWPKLAVDQGFNATEIGTFFAVLGLVQTVTFAVMGVLHVWRFRRYVLYAAQILAALSVVAMGLVQFVADTRMLYIAFGLFGAIMALVYTSSIYYRLFNAEKRGSVHEGLVGSGALLGPLYGGALARVLWIPLPFVLMPGLVFAAIIAEQRMYRRRQGSR